MKKSGIYQIKNTQNGKIYIGQTRDLKLGIYEHLRVLRRGNTITPIYKGHLINTENPRLIFLYWKNAQ